MNIIPGGRFPRPSIAIQRCKVALELKGDVDMRNAVAQTALILILLLTGCTAALPPKTEVRQSYTLLGVKSYSLDMNCEKANVDPAINRSFLKGYCQMLEGSIKVAMQRINPELTYLDTKSDIRVNVTLEELQGGNAAARLWIGFGAGRSVSTVYVNVLRGTESLSEGRVTETTTLTNIMTGTYSNEDALMQDVPLLAKKLAEFISDPIKFKRENQI